MSRAQLVETGETVHVGHSDVQEHEVRVRLSDERQHLRAGLRFADDLEATVGFERTLDPVEDEPVVVGDHDAHATSVAQGSDGPETPRVTRALSPFSTGTTLRVS